ncbi:TPA: hypothetical protein LVL79_002715 [Klebsiella oxytoca]|nr:hypothetical protein [Klebsiella oxytoca]
MSIDIVKDYLKSIFLPLVLVNYQFPAALCGFANGCILRHQFRSSRCLARCSIKRVYSLTDRRLFGL